MERSVESSFGQSGQMREKHLKNLAESGAGADAGRAAGLSLEGQRETGANVGSDALHVETNYNKQTAGTLKYDTGNSNYIQATIERTKANQAAAKEAAREGKVDEWEMVGGDEEAPMVIDRAAVEKSAAEDQLEKAKRRAQLAAEDETRKSA